METPFPTSYLDCSQIGQSVLETGKVINIFEKTVCSDEKRFAKVPDRAVSFSVPATLIHYPKGTFIWKK